MPVFSKTRRPVSQFMVMAVAAMLMTMMSSAQTANAQAGQFGHSQPTPPVAEDLVHFEIFPDVEFVEADSSFHMVAYFEIEPKWHMYWKNPGAGAAAPDIKFELPGSITQTGPAIWPRPYVKQSSTGDVYSYARSFAVFIPVRASEQWTYGGSTMVSAQVNFAVCDEKICLLGNRSGLSMLKRKSKDRFAQKNITPRQAELIETARKRLPHIIGSDTKRDAELDIVVARAQEAIVIRVPRHDITDPKDIRFIPGYTGGVSYELGQVEFDGALAVIRILVQVDRNNIVDKKPRHYGLIGLGTKTLDPSYEFNIPLDPEKPDDAAE